jgi:hypothetical protein
MNVLAFRPIMSQRHRAGGMRMRVRPSWRRAACHRVQSGPAARGRRGKILVCFSSGALSIGRSVQFTQSAAPLDMATDPRVRRFDLQIRTEERMMRAHVARATEKGYGWSLEMGQHQA